MKLSLSMLFCLFQIIGSLQRRDSIYENKCSAFSQADLGGTKQVLNTSDSHRAQIPVLSPVAPLMPELPS